MSVSHSAFSILLSSDMTRLFANATVVVDAAHSIQRLRRLQISTHWVVAFIDELDWSRGEVGAPSVNEGGIGAPTPLMNLKPIADRFRRAGESASP